MGVVHSTNERVTAPDFGLSLSLAAETQQDAPPWPTSG
jgi:hypothetical protein